MHHITNILTSLFHPSNTTGLISRMAEPLDHPCLAEASHAFIDDLPLPAFAVDRDGSIKLVEGE
ncbi:hypothetical protein [Tabrizicola sp.]|uniref:hypothetical protein n=1 Tax=Tabrizicola sp. TaxID=2005166 RepID=UPI003F417AA0